MEGRPAVRSVRAAALQLAGRVLLNLRLSDRDACDLAKDGQLTEVFNKLRARFSSGIVRGSARVARDREFQERLGVQEIIIAQRTADDGRAVRDFIERALSEHDRFLREKASWTDEYQSALSESHRFTQSHLYFRNFMIRCERLRSERSRELEESIGDLAILQGAKSELDQVFTRYLRQALNVVEVMDKAPT